MAGTWQRRLLIGVAAVAGALVLLAAAIAGGTQRTSI
jgi:hypothetical protein